MDGDVALPATITFTGMMFPPPSVGILEAKLLDGRVKEDREAVGLPQLYAVVGGGLEALGSRHSCSAALLPFTKMAGPPP